MDVAVVLVRPTEQGNVGAAARAMANMGLEQLILVEPAVPIGHTARAFAVGAGAVLDRCRRADSIGAALAPFQRVVGTSSTRARALEDRFLTPRELPAALGADPAGTATALVFGPERTGLTTDELALLSPIVRIPTSARQPTLNLAQAVLILSYELYLAELARDGADGHRSAVERAPEPAAGLADVEGLFDHLGEVLPAIGFARDDTAEATVRDLRRFFARAAPTEREVSIFRGILRRTQRSLDRLPASAPRGGAGDGGTGSDG